MMRVDMVRQRSESTGVTMDSYAESVARLEQEGATVGRAGDYLVAVTHDLPQGHYEADSTGLIWREAAPFNTVRFDVAVADAQDGRFVPGLTVHLAAERNGRTLAAARCGFRWHPSLHRYTAEIRLPAGRYDLTVRIDLPNFPRDDSQAGLRYAGPVVLRFSNVAVHKLCA
jgi:hypothetical protein